MIFSMFNEIDKKTKKERTERKRNSTLKLILLISERCKVHGQGRRLHKIKYISMHLHCLGCKSSRCNTQAVFTIIKYIMYSQRVTRVVCGDLCI